VSFLPKKTKSGEAVSYASYSNKVPLLRMDVVDTQTGAVKGSLHYNADAGSLPFYDMEQLTGMNYAFSVKVLEGSYELPFWAGTKHFYTYPFQVDKKTNADPYAPVHDFYFLHGPWEDWGHVEFGPDGHFIFNCYLTYQTTTVPNSARWNVRKSNKYLVKLYREGKMVAVHNLNSENKFNEGDIQLDNGKWRKYDATLHKYPVPNKNDKPFFKKEDLKDGNYTVEVLLKDEAGTTITHKYGFIVKDNAVVPNEKADRTKNTNPLQVLEQGRDRFFVKKM
jgi:hypothetical protein